MKHIVALVLIVMMVPMVMGFMSVELAYLNDLKEVGNWDIIEGEVDVAVKANTSDGVDSMYKAHVYAKLDKKELRAYAEIDVEGADFQEVVAFPTVKLYVDKYNVYVNKDFVEFTLNESGYDGKLAFEEDFLMVDVREFGDIWKEYDEYKNKEIMGDIKEFLGKIGTDIDLGMVKEGNTYKLDMDSDKIIDTLEVIVRAVIMNIDKLPESIAGELDFSITEEERLALLEMYDMFMQQYKDEAKQYIKGSKYSIRSKIEDTKYDGIIEVVVKVPTEELDISVKTSIEKRERLDIQFPVSVRVVTSEELESIWDLSRIGYERELHTVMGLDGSYTRFNEGMGQGRINVGVIDGQAYMRVRDANELFGVNLGNTDRSIHIRELDNYGYDVYWNETERLIEIYRIVSIKDRLNREPYYETQQEVIYIK